jgi:hypothetical protein
LASSWSVVSAVSGFLALVRRRRRFGFGLDTPVDGLSGAAPMTVSGERAGLSDVISDSFLPAPSIQRVS